MKLQVTAAAKRLLLDQGFSDEFGARPMRRQIQSAIEAPLSESILQGKFSEGDTVKVDAVNGYIDITKALKNQNKSTANTSKSRTKAKKADNKS